MTTGPYKATPTSATRYEFESVGLKGTVRKGVEIKALQRKNTFNIGFGDILPDGTIDDNTETNNNDLIAVFATIIEIMKDYLKSNPSAILFFQGNTDQKNRIYQYILQRNYPRFEKVFNITAISGKNDITQEVEYDPSSEEKYLGFLVQKK